MNRTVACNRIYIVFRLCASIALILLASACGTGTATTPMGNTGTGLTGNTVVTVLASSTANDQISRYMIGLNSLTLTSQSGKTVTLFATPQTAEYIHLNGNVEPLATVTIPQDIYVSATASVQPGGPICVAQDTSAGEILSNGTIGYGPISSSDVTVKLPAPIAVTGNSMGLALNLQVSSSVSSFNCVSNTPDSASITPTFHLGPVVIGAQPTNSANGKASGLHGFIASVANIGNTFSVTGADGPTWQVSAGTNTRYQGIASTSQLLTGKPVDMDVVIQPDGSLLATRVVVYDTTQQI
jgi:hypothetical protein